MRDLAENNLILIIILKKRFHGGYANVPQENQNNTKIPISEEFKQDVQWFIKPLPHFNGIRILKKQKIQDCNT